MTEQVAVRLGKVHVCISSDSVEGDLVEEYTPAAAREFAAELVGAAGQAESQQREIEAACAEGHDWSGANWGDGGHARTVWRCRREGCPGRREQPGHHVDDSAAIASLLAALPPDDELGATLLDFERYPNLTIMGRRMSREERIDAAAIRGHMTTLLRAEYRKHHQLSQRGPFNIPIHVDPTMPEGGLLILGSCTCRHPVTNHTQLGCGICPCPTPISRLAAVIKNVDTR